MDGMGTSVMTYAAQPAAAAQVAGQVPAAAICNPDATGAAEESEAPPRARNRKERLSRLLLASRQFQQR